MLIFLTIIVSCSTVQQGSVDLNKVSGYFLSDGREDSYLFYPFPESKHDNTQLEFADLFQGQTALGYHVKGLTIEQRWIHNLCHSDLLFTDELGNEIRGFSAKILYQGELEKVNSKTKYWRHLSIERKRKPIVFKVVYSSEIDVVKIYPITCEALEDTPHW